MLLRTFFGSTFIEKDKLEEAEIYHPIKLEYYKEINEDDIQKIDMKAYNFAKQYTREICEYWIFEIKTHSMKEI